MNRKKIKQAIADLFAQYGVLSAPVDVVYLSNALGIELRIRNFEKDLSGFAYQKDGEKIVGVNANEGYLRQRFTIAHELGHIFMHPRTDLSVDKNFAMRFRNGVSSQGTDLKEIEANYFAAELLMPEEFLKEDIENHQQQFGGVDFESDEVVSQLAKKYKVSRHAMLVRLASLHYL